MRFLSTAGAMLGTLFMFVFFFGLTALAQDVNLPPATNADVFAELAALIGVSTTEAVTTLAIVAAAMQLISKFIMSPLWDGLKLDPKYKFLLFAIVSLAGTVIPLMMQGATFLSALTSGGALLLLMQYGHRIYELFIEKKEPATAQALRRK